MIRKPRTQLMRMLQKAFGIASRSVKTKVTPDDILGELYNHNYTRRKFIERFTKSAIALTAVPMVISGCSKDINAQPDETGNESKLKSSPRIVIIGAGMAGLNCAYHLKKSGFSSTVYEATDRAGGRIRTAKNIMATGLTTELGGEFIDSGHKDMISLSAEFGLKLLDTNLALQTGLIKDMYYFNNQAYSLADVIQAFLPVANVIQSDIDALPDTITFNNPGTAVNYDNISLQQYIQNLNCTSWLKDLLTIAYVTEYGLDAGDQSCINLLFLISTDTSAGSFEVFGESDERFKIKGGNQKLTNALAMHLGNQIKYERKFEAAIQNANGTYIVTFKKPGGGYTDVNADILVFALPFTLLREASLSLNLPAWKQNAIDNLGYGTNAKLFMGFNNRPWQTTGYSGYCFTDAGFQTGWDNSLLQSGNAGGYTMYFGGTSGLQSGNGSVMSQVNANLPLLDLVFPGSSGQHNGNISRFHWPTHPYTKGSYACYKTGQWTSIAGAEKRPVGNIYFAGEHCSLNFQGYMNGAAETGRKVANKILGFN